MAGYGVAAKGGASVALVSDTPTTAAGVAGGYIGNVSSGLGSLLNTSSPTFWVAAWFLVLLGVIFAIFHGLLF
ncbi:MAG: hypothetical protein ACHQX0_05135 [Desulfobaccales bacterium]